MPSDQVDNLVMFEYPNELKILTVENERANKETQLVKCKQSIQNLQAEIVRAQGQLPEVKLRIEHNTAEVSKREEHKSVIQDELSGV